ncbi:MAG: bifunctional tRNA (5-methylaminomethyl-2-thiouridine)(34)-methyltransferase MnmD/FAD-dependent 5-carboxymethylaminomethyl-2-thiouridine(34) oxidoreductase MnmC [Plesiomonas sp.]|uniref:bifunctional tRNA (5-methylaminomethyl-2-thiouridine)(34)-methyltransferase MnmD/FAD-dependent 5-carboxymethylaminomethyl-2-thiouridine(34) oxidoreductase MnmC n=1 Tax=Plesiomonas sp. TaxID=2486279 RepID=UPI003F346B34
MNNSLIQQATLHFNEQGTPVSSEFGDVYFSNDNGLEETQYVFLDGNQLAERWHSHEAHAFIIAETGFGTGLNFLTVWQAFRQFKMENPHAALKRLHFISFEKFPLSISDLQLAHQSWPQLADLCNELHQHWPLPLSGCQRMLLDQGTVVLDLWFGDVNQTLPALNHSYDRSIDAWFLDGFAPSKNPDMWQQTLFEQMVRLTRDSGTFATFTAAGFVRRGLQAAGFSVIRRKGFAHKREMLHGHVADRVLCPLSDHIPTAPIAACYARPKASHLQDVAIIGGGIASALLAHALMQRGAQVTLYCADTKAAQGASGNRQGALYPLLNGEKNALARFFAYAFTFARQQYDALAAADVAFDHQWCGVLQLGYDHHSSTKLNALLNTSDGAPWPTELVCAHTTESANQRAGVEVNVSAAEYPQGGWLYPAKLTENVLNHLEKQGLTVHYQHSITALERTDNHWLLSGVSKTSDAEEAHNSSYRHAVVVLANGHRVTQYTQSERLPLSSVRGQVSHVPTHPALSALRTVLCYEGYLTPTDLTPITAGDNTHHHCLGATYGRSDTDTALRAADQQENLAKLQRSLPNATWAKQIQTGDKARAAIRCATRDHFPMMGAVPDYVATLSQYADLQQQLRQSPETIAPAPYHPDLFVLAALGSRGLTSAPLLAELLAAQMNGEPLPLEEEILQALNPNRYWIRKLLKGKPIVMGEQHTAKADRN